MTPGNYVLFFLLNAIALSRETCDNGPAQVHSTRQGIQVMVESWFPSNIEFNESCVAEGCPALNNFRLCPANVDMDKLHKFFDLISGCMTGPICGLTIDRRPIMPMTLSTEEFFSDSIIEGFLTSVPGTGNLYNICNIKVELLPGQTGHLPLQMTFMIPNVRARGIVDLQFGVSLDWLPIILPKLAINLPNVTYNTEFEFASNISLNLSSSDSAAFEFQFLNPVVKASYEYGGVKIPAGFPNILQMLTETSQFLMEDSNMAKSMATLFKKLYQSAIEMVSKNCV